MNFPINSFLYNSEPMLLPLPRVSTDSPHSVWCRIFLDGKELRGCVFADSALQIAVCLEMTEDNVIVHDANYRPIAVVHRGDIEIREDETHKWERYEAEKARCEARADIHKLRGSGIGGHNA